MLTELGLQFIMHGAWKTLGNLAQLRTSNNLTSGKHTYTLHQVARPDSSGHSAAGFQQYAALCSGEKVTAILSPVGSVFVICLHLGRSSVQTHEVP